MSSLVRVGSSRNGSNEHVAGEKGSSAGDSNGLTYGQIDPTDGGVSLSATEHDVPLTLAAEQLLIATGRIPNTDELGLEQSGIATGLDANAAYTVWWVVFNNPGLCVGEPWPDHRCGDPSQGSVTGQPAGLISFLWRSHDHDSS